MEKKMTKRDYFELIKKELADNTAIVEFCDHEIGLLDKKKANGSKKVNTAMEKDLEIVYEELAKFDRATASELISKGDLSALANEFGVTVQKVASRLNRLVDLGRATKVTEKKKSYFSVVAVD